MTSASGQASSGGDRHRRQSLSVRLPEADAVWVEQYAAATGVKDRAVIGQAVIELRGRVEGRRPVPVLSGRGCAAGLGWPV